MKQQTKLSGVQKAAILMIALGPDISSNILKKLPDNMIEKITYEIANTPHITSQQRNEVLKEFMDMSLAHDYISEGGLDYARNLLTKALGSQRAKEIIDTVSEITQQRRPLEIARKADAQQLFNTISKEHPQTIALILCYLQPDKAASILSGLPQDLQSDVAYRVATMQRTSPKVIKQVESVLEKKLSSLIGNEYANVGGVDTLVGILNSSDRGTEKNILEELESKQPELAEQVREGLFVFEDITLLDNTAIQRVLREVDNRDLALALKGSSEDVANVIYKNLSKRAAETLKEDIDFMGPVRLSEVETAQQKIVSVIRMLDEAGEIIISRGGEDDIVL
ncbi:flagellar motor switch protein FliG [Garciella nitratireducens]|uniref:Flagellar motor switch protein FliG n=1 Tax=Garciella nitratireducens DSM 15102 TaxID=1121911 RepID=A0A1T4LDX2_9FIRM|nr:flagellar motor switch protein FliG [Garciella nitratireducens]RBP46766.1 flagellar motor switch protein FliG [Garciella nitratireducens]SJZ52935.1 flagellar motor switch protein FliG [Garciella nitratireducens DSM 15102]